MNFKPLIFSVPLVLLYATVAFAEISATIVTYERDVRPILKAHCFHCHGEGETIEGELDLRLRRLIARGGESGPAIVAGDVEASSLFQRIKSGEMPPEDIAVRPTKEELDLIARWIAAGAMTARDEPEDLDPANYITEEERNFWSFQPVRRQQPPLSVRIDQARTPIDSFVLARLQQQEFSMNEDAERRSLVRRASFGLTGLPPSTELSASFLANDAPDAYDRLVDRLLASPRYGERWGRHWLDVAGYADSEGYTDADVVRPDAWKYRDYVIRSMNDDLPFDQFVQQQLAGDEMVDQEFKSLPADQVGKLIATGFLRMAPDGTGSSGVDQGVARNEVIAKSIQIVSTSLLGLTVGCAQCHNHRYDPISQEDYYRFRAIFDPAYNWENWLVPSRRRVSLYSDTDRKQAAEIEAMAKEIEEQRTKKQEEYIARTFERELAKLPSELHDAIRQARDTPEKKLSAAQQKLLRDHPTVNVTAKSLYLYDRKASDELKTIAAKAAKVRTTKPKERFIRALTERNSGAPPKSFVFSRGDHEQPKQEVQPAELTVLSSAQASIPVNDSARQTTGRRLAYANSLTNGKHPLPARVAVNRIWLNHFGRGIVETPGDFGQLGTRPSHPELLDWLASEFMSDWSMKRMHRLILTSSVYRQSARRDPAKDAVDFENRLYGRMSVRRLDAESLRDSVLSVGNQLNLKPFGPAVPVMADRVGRFVIGKENLNAGRPGKTIPMNGEEFRRSVWIQVRRSRPLSVMDPFDLPRMEPNCTSRASSTVAPQSLMLMNSDFAMTHAQNFARRVETEAGQEIVNQIRLVWRLAFSDNPSAEQQNDAAQFIDAQTKYFKDNPRPVSKNDKSKGPTPEFEALTSFCHAILSSNEFLYID